MHPTTWCNMEFTIQHISILTASHINYTYFLIILNTSALVFSAHLRFAWQLFHDEPFLPETYQPKTCTSVQANPVDSLKYD